MPSEHRYALLLDHLQSGLRSAAAVVPYQKVWLLRVDELVCALAGVQNLRHIWREPRHMRTAGCAWEPIRSVAIDRHFDLTAAESVLLAADQ